MSLVEISKKYFDAFSNKDLSSIKKMFSKDVYLRDWEIEATGIEEVLKANTKIFKSLNSIKVRPLRIYNDGNAVVAELVIDINDGEESLLVADVIEFNSNNKILNIRAYKG
mgnify:CR=1 FL=1